MHEDLLGYLLGALEPHEMQRVAQLLRDNPAAREELAKIERSLEPLEEFYQPVAAPPPDLVARTLANLPPLPSADENKPTATVELVSMQSGVEAPKSTTLTFVDWASGAVAVAVLLGFLLPALAQGRFEARKATCQDQLRQFGTALTSFVIRNQQNRLPSVAENGPEAFAGIYAIRLDESGLLEDPSIRWCPSLDRPDEGLRIGGDEMVSVRDLHEMSVDQLRQIQQRVGGHYAYTLGVIDKDHFTPPRFESRSSFAVMSDAPMVGISGGKIRADQIGHSGFGINVLYEDGRVQFISLSSLESMPDHPLFNHRGRAEAGVNIDDASLAPSWRPPFVNVRQR